MHEIQGLDRLSAHHCVLLAVHYATESNITALQALTTLRAQDLPLELTLQIILTYLSETVDPSTYIEYLDELANSASNPIDDPAIAFDLSSVKELSTARARKRRSRIELLPLVHPLYKTESDLDLLTHFLIHRAHRIDEETGLLDLVPQLLVPFLGHSEYLRTWFISTVFPLLRLGYEYYPNIPVPPLEEFARLQGTRALNVQLAPLLESSHDNAARDLQGVVGPWICGANERKRRKLSKEGRRASLTEASPQGMDDWEALFGWLLRTSTEDLALVTRAVEEWDGPEDIDLGGYDEGREYIDDETRSKLEIRYAQMALACLYLIEDSEPETLKTAHLLLSRIASLLSLEPPPNLNAIVSALPTYDIPESILHDVSASILQEDRLLHSDNVLTQPNPSTVRLLELLLFSSCISSSLQQNLSIREVARMYLRSDASEQLTLLKKAIHILSTTAKIESEQWKATRAKILWLWGWGSSVEDTARRHGYGVLGNLHIDVVETEILKGLLESSHYALAIEIYVQHPTGSLPLPSSSVERIVLEAAMHHYDNASNGNKSRGGIKRASDIASAFNPHFKSSDRFQRLQALLAATHAMSFYSLTLQHGVPFQPVNIRVSSDPLSLIQKLLSQNSRSYTHLDDMITIGQNLVMARPSTLLDGDETDAPIESASLDKKKAVAERRVIGMTVEAALAEDDFETAYSYVVNRLNPSTPSPSVSPEASVSSNPFSLESPVKEDNDDIAWRAALEAGRHRTSPSSSFSWGQNTTSRPDLRQLEQRMELLSQALLLTPPRHLEEVLAVWQECENEMTALLAEENEAEERFNDAADRRLPGAFSNETLVVQPRREVGRGAVEESPMGLFDVARGAAAAFSKSAFPLRGAAENQSSTSTQDRDFGEDSGRMSMDFSDSGSMSAEDRVRKRDLVANAVTGGLASGIGWVLGANPNAHQENR
ncbi:unnamed protein product [Periconia digitata]|uniref:Sec39 domain-containing protein n=1 Tax=Periconia digitata TaxID=1303443 RepID=A0A9W4XM49_9PLEO|nr:unnamed protein product [Periconia digitata]